MAEASIASLRQHHNELHTAVPALRTRGAKSYRIPDLPMFFGTGTSLPYFTIKLKVKLRTTADRILPEVAKVDYVVSCVEEKALAIIMAHMDEETEELTITTIAMLITKPKVDFRDLDLINTTHHNRRAQNRAMVSLPPTTQRLPASLPNLNTKRQEEGAQSSSE
ncbi:hypothetical protein Q9L58_010244 [Maublancomyces gigas]|uniref:Uncharacterized protein n=1 Tax=Discina gigas TaxID=1032678 RepID=A0ABR3G4P0_9PEZI